MAAEFKEPTGPVSVGTKYELVEGWGASLNSEYSDVSAIGVDSHDRVVVLTRGEARVVILNTDGTTAAVWGEDVFSDQPHGLTVAPDDTVYCVDDPRHVVLHFGSDGTFLDELRPKDAPSDTGYRGTTPTILRSAPPFNRPTGLAVAPSGDLYVTDGYGNARVHRFSPSGELLHSWGTPGIGPGQFNIVHGIAVAPDGMVLVADRENDRIQIFDPDGRFTIEWTDVQRPTSIALDADGNVYVSELWRRPQHESFRLGIGHDLPGRVSVFTPSGSLLARWGGGFARDIPGNFTAPHTIAVDSRGDVYIGEVSWHFTRGEPPVGARVFQKYTRAR